MLIGSGEKRLSWKRIAAVTRRAWRDVPRPQETPRVQQGNVTHVRPKQSEGPLGHGGMASVRLLEGKADGLAMFLETNGGGDLEGCERYLWSAKTDRSGLVLEKSKARGDG